MYVKPACASTRMRTHKKAYYQNLSREHQKALTGLRKDRSLTIKPADKGTCIVIQDTKDYLKDGLKELEDKTTYVELDRDTSLETAKEANELIKDCHMHKSYYQCSRNASTRQTSRTCGPKDYTGWERCIRTLTSWDLLSLAAQGPHRSCLNSHKLRPIVSCCSGPTQKLSQLCNNLLKVHLDSVQSLVTSSTEVIRIVEHLKVSPDTRRSLILATLDVKALYPSIPHEAGISMALQQAIPTEPPVSSNNSRKNMLKEMLKIILSGNTFLFAGRTFKQIKGIAMGTPVAPTWANLFMGKLETDALTRWQGTLPLLWLRYIDDIFTLFPGPQEELDSLLQHMNSQLSTIEFTMDFSKHKNRLPRHNHIQGREIPQWRGPRHQALF